MAKLNQLEMQDHGLKGNQHRHEDRSQLYKCNNTYAEKQLHYLCIYAINYNENVFFRKFHNHYA